MTRDALADKVLAVARSLADSPAVRGGLKTARGKRHLQPLKEAVSQHNGFLFIVVTNMQGIRYSRTQKRSESVNRSKAMTSLAALQEAENVAINRGFLLCAARFHTGL